MGWRGGGGSGHLPTRMTDSSGSPPSRRSRRRPEPTPTQRALGLLVRREHSRRELTRKLTQRGVAAEAAEAAVERLREAGWQDDARFAESLVRSRAAAGYGPRHLRAELAQHGLSREAIHAALEAFDGDWQALACDLVRRRFGALAPHDHTARRRAADLLIRRGFDAEHVRAATRFDPEDVD